jgi:hypothetical protein
VGVAANNILVANAGVSGDSNTIRLGTQASHTRTFIAGIHGTTIPVFATPLYINQNGQLGSQASSRRYKERIRDLNDVSQKILQLRPVQFHYKADPDGPVEYGLIAEEVAEVFPQLVLYGPEGEAESVRYDALVPLLVNELTRVQQSLEKGD